MCVCTCLVLPDVQAHTNVAGRKELERSTPQILGLPIKPQALFQGSTTSGSLSNYVICQLVRILHYHNLPVNYLTHCTLYYLLHYVIVYLRGCPYGIDNSWAGVVRTGVGSQNPHFSGLILSPNYRVPLFLVHIKG